MRHSARHYGQTENDLDNPLSETGRELAMRFGGLLPPWRHLRVFTSPSGRCVETGDLIRRGFGRGGTVTPRDDLSVFYVRDMRRVGGMLKHLGVDRTLHRWFDGEVDPQWMEAADASLDRLLACLLELFRAAPCNSLTLCVSHDWNLYLLTHLALGVPYAEQPRAEYLDCILFYEQGGQVRVADRHRGHRRFDFEPAPRPVSPGS
jgi:broad specificity phosphatase PhoE